MMLPSSFISNTCETMSQSTTKIMMPTNTFSERDSFISR